MNDKFVTFFNHKKVLTMGTFFFSGILVGVIIMLILNLTIFDKKVFVKGFVIEKIKVVSKDDKYEFSANMKSMQSKEVNKIIVSFYDKDKHLITKYTYKFDHKLKRSEKTKLYYETDKNIENAKIKYEVK